jgi:glutathione S-transferase
MFWEANNHELFVAGCISHMTDMAQPKETRDPMRVQRGDRALDILENHLQTANWMVAENLTAADIVLLAYTRQARLGGFDMSARPKVRNWVARCESAFCLQPV